MIIKSFISESASAALKQVREVMGGDAVVLKTRQVRDARGGVQVEVTALLDRPTVGQTERILEPSTKSEAEAPSNSRVDLTVKQEPSLPMNVSDQMIRRALRNADFSDEYAELLIESARNNDQITTDSIHTLSKTLTQDLDNRCATEFAPKLGDRIVVVGPAGMGKTSVLGKLAARLMIDERKKVRFSTLDNLKVGAADEIQTYADLFGVEVIDSRMEEDDMQSNSDCVTLIDTSALPKDAESLGGLIKKINSLKPTHTLLCLSAMAREVELGNQIELFRSLNPTGVILTMTDMSWRYGAVLSVAHSLNIPLTGLTDNFGGLGGINRPSGQTLAEVILNEEVSHEPSLI